MARPLGEEFMEFKKKGIWGNGELECWSVGVLECWSVGALECWSVGALERWSVGALERWSVGALGRGRVGAVYRCGVEPWSGGLADPRDATIRHSHPTEIAHGHSA